MSFFVVIFAFCIGILFGIFIVRAFDNFLFNKKSKKLLSGISTDTLERELEKRKTQKELSEIYKELKKQDFANNA